MGTDCPRRALCEARQRRFARLSLDPGTEPDALDAKRREPAFEAAPVLFGLLMDRGLYGATFFGAALVMLLSVGAALGVGNRTRT